MGNIIPLRRPEPVKAKPARRKPRAKCGRITYRRQLLDLLREQSRQAYRGDWTGCDALRQLAAAARGVGPRARRVIWSGIAFPLVRDWFDRVVCPQTGVHLVGVSG